MSDAAERGPFSLPKSRVHLIDKENKIYQFIGGNLRVAFFVDADCLVICTHGFVKKSQKTKSRDQNQATKARAQYMMAKAKKQLIFREDD